MREEAGHRPQGHYKDGLFSLEEVECIGACSWAPAEAGEFDFHENLTNAKMDERWPNIREKDTVDL